MSCCGDQTKHCPYLNPPPSPDVHEASSTFRNGSLTLIYEKYHPEKATAVFKGSSKVVASLALLPNRRARRGGRKRRSLNIARTNGQDTPLPFMLFKGQNTLRAHKWRHGKRSSTDDRQQATFVRANPGQVGNVFSQRDLPQICQRKNRWKLMNRNSPDHSAALQPPPPFSPLKPRHSYVPVPPRWEPDHGTELLPNLFQAFSAAAPGESWSLFRVALASHALPTDCCAPSLRCSPHSRASPVGGVDNCRCQTPRYWPPYIAVVMVHLFTRNRP